MTDLPTGADADPSAGERYLLLADITGYTGFMAGVEIEHGADFSQGIPAEPVRVRGSVRPQR